jgi:hypothetical protein
MGLTGGVSRGAIPPIFVDSLFHGINASRGKLSLVWHSNMPAKNLVFRLYGNNLERPLIERTPRRNSITLDLESEGLERGRSYFWNVSQKGESNSDYDTVHFWQQARYDSLLSAFDLETAVAGGEAERSFMTGFLLESARFIGEAGDYYRRAARQSDNALHEEVWKNYKAQYGFEGHER